MTSTVIPGAGDPDVAIVGDLNSYAGEDPSLVDGDEAAGLVEQADAGQLRDGIDEAGATQSGGFDIADDVDEQLVPFYADGLDRAVRGAHPTPDLRGLEGRAGGSRGGEQSVGVAEHDLAVGADVDEQAQSAVPVHAGGEYAGDDVAADVRAQRR